MTTLIAIIVLILVALAAVVALNDRPRGPRNQWGEGQSVLVKVNTDLPSVSHVLDWNAARDFAVDAPWFL